MVANWQDISTEALDAEKRQTRADQWATAQRQRVAAQWAEWHKQQVRQRFAEMQSASGQGTYDNTMVERPSVETPSLLAGTQRRLGEYGQRAMGPEGVTNAPLAPRERVPEEALSFVPPGQAQSTTDMASASSPGTYNVEQPDTGAYWRSRLVPEAGRGGNEYAQQIYDVATQTLTERPASAVAGATEAALSGGARTPGQLVAPYAQGFLRPTPQTTADVLQKRGVPELPAQAIGMGIETIADPTLLIDPFAKGAIAGGAVLGGLKKVGPEIIQKAVPKAAARIGEEVFPSLARKVERAAIELTPALKAEAKRLGVALDERTGVAASDYAAAMGTSREEAVKALQTRAQAPIDQAMNADFQAQIARQRGSRLTQPPEQIQQPPIEPPKPPAATLAAPGPGRRPSQSIGPEADKIVRMYHEGAPKVPEFGQPNIAEQARRDLVRAWTNSRVDADILQEDVLRRTGGNLRPMEDLANLSRLDSGRAAEMHINEILRPATRAIGADPEAKKLYDAALAYMTAKGNLEVADAMGVRVERTVLAEPLKTTPAEKVIQTETSRVRMLIRLRDQAQQAGDAAKVATYNSNIAKSQQALTSAQRRAMRQVTALDAQRTAAAKSAGAQQTVSRQFSGGVNRQQSEQAMAEVRQSLTPEQMQKVEKATQGAADLNAYYLKRRLDSGIIDQDEYDLLRNMYPTWTPTNVLEHIDERAVMGGQAKKLTVTAADLKRYTLEGTNKAREDPFLASARNAYRTEALVRKNDAFRAFDALAERDPTLAGWLKKVTPGAEHTASWQPIQGFKDGKKIEYLVPPYVQKAIEREAQKTIPLVGPLLAVWRALVTSRSVRFLGKNAFLDAGTFMLREMARGGDPQAAPRALKELVTAYADAFQGLFTHDYGPEATRYFAGGGGMSGWMNMPAPTGQAATGTGARIADWITKVTGIQVRTLPEDELRRALLQNNVLEVKSAADVRRLIKDVFTLAPVEGVGERIELAPRVASMRLAERRGASASQAVRAGRTVTIDFNEGGNWAKTINQIVPFFNVSIQGGATLARATRANLKGMAATVLTTLVAPTLAAEAYNRGVFQTDPATAEQWRKDWADVPQYVKDGGIMFRQPGEAPVDASGNRHPQYSIVRTREFSPFVVLSREIASRTLGDDPRGWLDLAGGIAQNVSPIQSTDLGGIAAQALPPGLSTAIELYAGKDFYRNTDIVSRYADERASPLARAGADVFGGRPSQWEFAGRDLGGDPAAIASEVSNAITGNPPNAAGPQSVPVLGGFAKAFVRGDIGARLDKARDNVMSDETRQIFKDAGIHYEISPVSYDIKGVSLTLDERATYQEITNRLVNQTMKWLSEQPSWSKATPDQRDEAARYWVSKARAKAMTDAIDAIGRQKLADRWDQQNGVAR